MNKIVIILKDGAVVEVYADHPSNYDVEVIDFDTQDSDVRAAAEERLSVIKQHLCKYQI
jgi:hypothetical protein